MGPLPSVLPSFEHIITATAFCNFERRISTPTPTAGVEHNASTADDQLPSAISMLLHTSELPAYALVKSMLIVGLLGTLSSAPVCRPRKTKFSHWLSTPIVRWPRRSMRKVFSSGNQKRSGGVHTKSFEAAKVSFDVIRMRFTPNGPCIPV